MTDAKLDEIRRNALQRMEKSELRRKAALVAAAFFELLFLVTFLLTADLHNRMHLLLLIATVGGYMIIVMGLVVLATHIDHGLLRVLKAVEMNGQD